MEPDFQSVQSASSATLDTLNTIVAWLRQEGFYAAESALLGEVESRFPDQPQASPFSNWLGSTQFQGLSAPSPKENDVLIDLGSTQCLFGDLSPQEVPNSAERVLELWRSKSNTPAGSPGRKSTGQGTPPLPPVLLLSVAPGDPSDSSTRSPLISPDTLDEYDDDDDPGYWRVPATNRDCQSLLSPFGPDASSPSSYDQRRDNGGIKFLQKSPSSSSLPYSCSRHSSLDLRLPTESSAPVLLSGGVNEHNTKKSSPSSLPPLPGSGLNNTNNTARWVFDRQNSASSEAYKSLLSYLDQQSPRTQPLPLGSTEASTDGATTTGPSPRTPTATAGTPTSPPSGYGDTPRAMTPKLSDDNDGDGEEAEGKQPWREPSASELRLSSSPVSRPLPPSTVFSPDPSPRGHEVKEEDEDEHAATVGKVSRLSSLSESVLNEALADAFGQMGVEDHVDARKEEKGVGGTMFQGKGNAPHPILAVKTSDVSTNTGTLGDSPDGSQRVVGCGRVDLFSFPVTSPSDHGDRAPGPFFGSWPSFKNLESPNRSQGGGYGSNEEDVMPGLGGNGFGRRLGHRPRLSATSSSGNFSSPNPPQPSLALKFPQHVRRSSSQQGLTTVTSTPITINHQYMNEVALYHYDEEVFEDKYDVFNLRIVHRRGTTGFEASRELPLRINDLIAGRYQIVDLLGQAAFSRAVQALDLKTGALVCLKVVKNNKDYFDQSLDEIKILRHVNQADPGDEYGILRLYDYFYFKEHLILVTELLRANLYEFSKYNRETAIDSALYFSCARIQSVARQVLRSLSFLHSLGLVHADLKPENILMKSYSNCEVKVIDLGSSCFLTDRLSSYVQSRSYRAPEVILGLPYGQKIDVWSLGCIIAELATGRVLFHNSTPAAILARMESILGPVPQNVLAKARYAPRFYTNEGKLYERNKQTGQLDILKPKKSSLGRRVPEADSGMLDFIGCLLQIDPVRRPTATEALSHPWLQYRY